EVVRGSNPETHGFPSGSDRLEELPCQRVGLPSGSHPGRSRRGGRSARPTIHTRRSFMSVVYITEFAYTDSSTANYDWAKEQIGDDPIDGLIVHTAGFDTDEKVFRIIDVWE